MRVAKIFFYSGAAAVAACGPVVASQTGSAAAAQEAPARPQWSWPEVMENPQVMPADTDVARLRGTMMFFVQSLGVRCNHCHVSTGEALSEFDFASDDNPRKEIAREMMRMTAAINQERLTQIEGLSEPRVTCFTCHRGDVSPATSPDASQS